MQLINPEIRVENVNTCNASCVMCPHSTMTRGKARMPDDVFYNLIREAKSIGAETISIFGFGEPLMDIHIAKKISYCTKLGLKTFVTTNASLLNLDNSKRLLEAGLSHIRFSAHGISEKKYQAVHKGLSFFSVITNITNFIQLNKKLNNPCKVSVSVIPMHGESTGNIKDFWGSSIDYLEIWKPHGWAGKQNYRWQPTKKDMCERPFSGPVQIQADGRVIPCCFITDAEIVLGDIYKDTIEDILKGDKYNKLRQRHENGDLAGLPCEHCDQMFIYDESNNPLLYSSRDKNKQINCTSSTKFKLEV